jgi:hypothetical protein
MDLFHLRELVKLNPFSFMFTLNLLPAVHKSLLQDAEFHLTFRQ